MSEKSSTFAPAKVWMKIEKEAIMKNDPTLMTKEEFFARLEEAEKGPRIRMLPNETLDEFLNRVGI